MLNRKTKKHNFFLNLYICLTVIDGVCGACFIKIGVCLSDAACYDKFQKKVFISLYAKIGYEWLLFIKKRRDRKTPTPSTCFGFIYYIIPIPAFGFIAGAGSGAGISVTAHSVVRIKAAIDAAF